MAGSREFEGSHRWTWAPARVVAAPRIGEGGAVIVDVVMLAAAFGLIVANAVFVAAEFSLVTVERSQVQRAGCRGGSWCPGGVLGRGAPAVVPPLRCAAGDHDHLAAARRRRRAPSPTCCSRPPGRFPACRGAGEAVAVAAPCSSRRWRR